MLLQTNSYVVPKEKRSEHSRLVRRFRQILARLGCDHFEVFEQVGANWGSAETTGRFVQIMRFRDRRHQQQVQTGERTDPAAQQLIKEFCALINFPYQQQQGLFAVGFYTSALPISPTRAPGARVRGGDIAAGEGGGDSGLGSLENVAVETLPDEPIAPAINEAEGNGTTHADRADAYPSNAEPSSKAAAEFIGGQPGDFTDDELSLNLDERAPGDRESSGPRARP